MQQDHITAMASAIPWELIGGGGAAVLAAGLSIYLTKMHMDAMAEARTEFTLALQRLADDFGSRVEALTNRVLESNNRVERLVADALREKGHP